MEKKGWKILAIIFMILFILETLYFVWAVSSVIEDGKQEDECFVNVCAFNAQTGESKIADTYYFDTLSDICYCYKSDEIVKNVVIK